MNIKLLFQTVAGIAMTALVLFIAACQKPAEHAHDPNVDYYTCSMHPSVKLHDPKAKCPICNMNLIPVMKKAEPKAGDVDYYTCAMHPSVKLQDPNAKCPICNMKLIPVMKKGSGGGATNVTSGEQPTVFVVSTDRQQQIGVTYTNALRKPLRFTVRTVGAVSANKERHWDYVARVDGYVKELNVFSRGEIVEKGQPLLSIYSPDLLATQREFMDLLRARDDAKAKGSAAVVESTERLIESARTRLRLWNIGD